VQWVFERLCKERDGETSTVSVSLTGYWSAELPRSFIRTDPRKRELRNSALDQEEGSKTSLWRPGGSLRWMDSKKTAFLFGEVTTAIETLDEDERRHLIQQRFLAEVPGLDDGSSEAAFLTSVHHIVADQIVKDDPPEVWRTACRLLDTGLTEKFVMSNLVLAANTSIVESLPDGDLFDAEHYNDFLDQLPLPPVRELFEVLVAIVRDRRFVTAGELVAESLKSFRGVKDPSGQESVNYVEEWIELALDKLLDLEPSVMMVSPDLIVHVPTLLNGEILTHRLTESERSGGMLVTGADLAPLLSLPGGLLLADGSGVEIDSLGNGVGILEGPPGWLEHLQSETLVGFRIDGDTLLLESVGELAAPAPSVVKLARAAYDREVLEPWLPVRVDEIVAVMLLEQPGVLSTPTVPLSVLLAESGLEQRGVEFAHEESVWRRAHRLVQMQSLYDRLPDDESRQKAAQLLDLLDAEEPDSEEVNEALSTLRDPRLLAILTDELLDLDDDDEQLREVFEFANDLLAGVRRPADAASVRFLLAVVNERSGDPLAGQAQLELAIQADPEFAPAVDRLAWYLSDRGDAAGATRLRRRLGVSTEDVLREIPQFVESHPNDLGRNAPCWCGSGRKFKHCHLGQPPTLPLPERVGWLYRKAVAYLEHRGGSAYHDLYDYAVARADGDKSEKALDRAFSDPMMIDVVLHEGGWFDSFIEERGALLPDDEAMLATAWALVDRTLFETVEVRAGEGLVVRDLRTAEILEVRERSFSRQARVGQVFCGRAVPDGEQHQFIGGLFMVATGREKDLLNLLDDGDGEELLEWIAAQSRPPRLETRESEALRTCRVELQVPDPAAARIVLDRFYEKRSGNEWTEHHRLANGESILRASITLEGKRITINTLSEPRVERVLDVLMSEVPYAKVISDERNEIDPSNPSFAPSESELSLDDPGVREVFRTFIAERERAWCDEEIPALGGLTPRQAADDPAGRESLERLLAEYGSFVDPEEDPEMVLQHPDRLRHLLGLI
jgi:SEC-C motif